VSSDLFTAAGQKRLRHIVSGLLPKAKAAHVAEAVAAGWGQRNHAALLAALGGDANALPQFDPVLCLNRLDDLMGSLNFHPRRGDHIHILWAATQVTQDIKPPIPPRDLSRALVALELSRQAIKKKDWLEATHLATHALRTGSPGQIQLAFDLLKEAANHSPAARLNMAIAMISGDGIPPDVEGAVRLLEPLCDNEQKSIAAAANATLGDWVATLGRSADHRRAMMFWHRAMELGNAHSAFNAGLAYQQGRPGVPIDLHQAAKMYRIAADLGHVYGMTNLGVLLQNISADEAVAWFEKAAALGDEKAAVYLTMIDRMAADDILRRRDVDEDQAESCPVERVTPWDTKRPQLVADALVEASIFDRGPAETMTAMLYGFNSWSALMQAAQQGPGDLPDEAVSAEIQERRFAGQVFVLAEATEMPHHEAELLIEMLAPTASETKPSLKGFQDRLDDVETTEMPHDPDSGSARADSSPDKIEFSIDQFRTLHPVQPDVWIPVLEQLCGWTIRKAKLKTAANGSRVGWVNAPDGTSYPIHISSISYVPGDLGDVQEQEVKQAIAAKTPRAVLLFNRVTGWTGDKSNGRGAVYGGQVLSNGVWDHFVIRLHQGGLEDVLAQRCLMSGKPSEEFLKRFGEEDALSKKLAFTLVAYLSGEDEAKREFRTLRSASGWWLPL